MRLVMKTSKQTSTQADKKQAKRGQTEKRANKNGKGEVGERKTRGKWQIM